MYSIFKNAKVSINTLKYNADNETLTGAVLDMQGYDSVAFIGIAMSGETFATWAIKAQMNADTGFTAASTMAGTNITFSTTTAATGHGLTTLEVHNPRMRYVRALMTVPNVTTARAAGVVAIQFNAKDKPASNAGELWIAPAAGTA